MSSTLLPISTLLEIPEEQVLRHGGTISYVVVGPKRLTRVLPDGIVFRPDYIVDESMTREV